MQLLELLFNPEGRIGRLQFIGGYIASFLLVCVIYIIPLLIQGYLYISTETYYGGDGSMVVQLNSFHTNFLSTSWFAILFYVPGTILLLYTKICLDIKRFRDTGFSPWFILLFLVPYLGILVFLFLLLFPARDQ